MIVISQKPDGYRRAGLSLKRGENDVNGSNLTDEKLQQLQADPNLVIVADQQPSSALEHLADLIAKLDPDDAALWTADGLPKAAALQKNTTPRQRQAAWELFQQRQAGSEK